MESKLEVVRFRDGRYGVRRLPKDAIDMSSYGWSEYEYYDFSACAALTDRYWWQNICEPHVCKWIRTRFLWRAKRVAKNYRCIDEGLPINEA